MLEEGQGEADQEMARLRANAEALKKELDATNKTLGEEKVGHTHASVEVP